MKKDIDRNRVHRAVNATNEILNAISNEISVNDCLEFKNIIETNSFSKELLEDMADESKHRFYHANSQSENKEADVKRLVEMIHAAKRKTLHRRILYSATSVAAAVMLFSFLFFNESKKEDGGRRFVVSEAVNTKIKEPILIVEAGDTIPVGRQNEYQDALRKKSEGDSIINQINTLVIPAGYSYDVALADGTKVKLNAGSRLKYPTFFEGDTREVELEGEAYFSVTKSDQKFIVHSFNRSVEVFGTEFTMRGNSNGDIETVLVEGSVGFKSSVDDICMITPGTKLSYVAKDNSITTESVDTYTYTAWIDNKFVYKEQSLSKVMNDIATWYGIKISSIKNIDSLSLTLVISRDTPIDDLMRVISLTCNINILKNNTMEYTIE